MKKKIIITLLVILAVIVPVSVFTGFAGETGIAAQSADTVSIDTEPMDPGVHCTSGAALCKLLSKRGKLRCC